jgi:hypothetical protein
MTDQAIEKRVAELEARNRRVEGDKAWETSWVRRISIMLSTYLVVVAYLHFIVHTEAWINALVPVMGFVLSTLTISALKKQWLRRFRSHN